MIALACIGLLLTGAFGAFALMLHKEHHGMVGSHLPLGLGVLIGQALFWTGVITLAIGRQTLVLDSILGTGEYKVRSPIVDVGKSCRFKLKHVHSVTIETTKETRPGRSGHADVDATVHRVRLRLNKPRRAITLDETEHGHLDRLEELAQQVAAFLGQSPAHMDDQSR